MTTIEVTSSDIANGIRGAASSCPVALAVNRAIEKQYSAFATRSSISIFDDDRWINDHQCPKPVAAFIEQFDAGEPVQPLTFILKLNKREASGGLR